MSTELNLYSIESEYLAIAEQLLNNGGETDEEIDKALAINKENAEVKLAKYSYVCRKFDGEAFLIKQEIERLQNLLKSRENASNKLQERIKSSMELFGLKSIESQNVKLMLIRTKPSVVVDETILPKKYMKKKVVTTYAPDKVAIKNDLDAGKKIKGARLKENERLDIK